jgi:hypothetical protein
MPKGFQKGRAKTGGREKGTPNKHTADMKAAWEAAFDALQQGPNKLEIWAQENPSKFYDISFKLIPVKSEHSVEFAKKIVIEHNYVSCPENK